MTFKTTGLRFAASASTALLALSGLAACGGGGAATTAATTEAAPVEATTVAATTEEAKEPSYVEWGYTNIPYNEDLDILFSDDYYVETTSYYTTYYDGVRTIDVTYDQRAYNDSGYVTADTDTEGNLIQKNASIDGKIISANYELGVYYEFEASDSSEDSSENTDEGVSEDDFEPTVKYVGTGTGTIELTDDATEYTYYEYTDIFYNTDEYGNETEETMTVKLYVQGEKLVAQTYIFSEDDITTTVYTKVQSEIPDGFFAFPDTTGLEKQEW